MAIPEVGSILCTAERLRFGAERLGFGKEEARLPRRLSAFFRGSELTGIHPAGAWQRVGAAKRKRDSAQPQDTVWERE